jgi:hypothetical protein
MPAKRKLDENSGADAKEVNKTKVKKGSSEKKGKRDENNGADAKEEKKAKVKKATKKKERVASNDIIDNHFSCGGLLITEETDARTVYLTSHALKKLIENKGGK